MTTITRRSLVGGALGVAGAAALGQSAAASPRRRHDARRPSIGPDAETLTFVQSGDVTTDRAVVWGRTWRPGRLVVLLQGRHRTRVVKGPWADASTDFTAQVLVTGLRPGTDYRYTVRFEHRGQTVLAGRGRFRTADRELAPTSFAFTGDTAGQGYGINPDLGGMTAYRSILQTRPDFLLHSGDNIYADGPIVPELKEADGQLWHNRVEFGVDHVAQDLTDYRGRYRYNQLDPNIRALYAEVPVLAQWDDHEVRNNWYPHEAINDPRYDRTTNVDQLVPFARQAFFENMPLSTGPSAAGKVYRSIPRGRMLEVFLLDERTYRDANTLNDQVAEVAFLGQEQLSWLLDGLERSTAVWKFVASDMPLSLVVPDGTNYEAWANGNDGEPRGRELEVAHILREIKRRGIRNVVWLTADVHYAQAVWHDPAKGAFHDYDGFYEFVAGPISAGAFGPNAIDHTFGPDVLFEHVPAYAAKSPRDQKDMWFGLAELDACANLTVSLRNGLGETGFSTQIAPQR